MLAIHLLGSFQVDLEGQPAPTFGSDKARALLAYLAVESDRPHRREALADLLWPEHPANSARVNLRQTVHRLRNALAAWHPDSSGLIVTLRDVRLAAADDLRLDVTEFLSLLDFCRQHHPRDLAACEPCRQRLERAVQLYRGDFLTGFSLPDSQPFAEWALFKLEELRGLALSALEALASHHLRAGDYEQAAEYARRQLELEPWREEAHAQRMRALALAGQREAALRQFELCRRVLADELGKSPRRGWSP